ncbi:hypothetical protein VFPPC_15366 [Pochonia chlamydosporia 170]|uniref:Uncharacterized protein n=1 Tax=Pochonia chlamydosporia 170 TaxID=1380566 RepID=A0A179G9G3_METCM|nr:hypothetical protein VFPPC_15366 [Pochonia chlamydosporia 170]OAQ73799.1 hypothetical protein VFPPC_15366 [Pochonia chlamydosporia 170]
MPGYFAPLLVLTTSSPICSPPTWSWAEFLISSTCSAGWHHERIQTIEGLDRRTFLGWVPLITIRGGWCPSTSPSPSLQFSSASQPISPRVRHLGLCHT